MCRCRTRRLGSKPNERRVHHRKGFATAYGFFDAWHVAGRLLNSVPDRNDWIFSLTSSLREIFTFAPTTTPATEMTARGDDANKNNKELPLHCFCRHLLDGLIVDIKESEVETFTTLVKAWPGSVKLKRPQDEKFPLEIVPPSPAVIRCIEEAWPGAIQEASAIGTLLLHRIVERNGPPEAAQFVAGRCPTSSPRSGQHGRADCAAQNYRIHGR
jgi:hypothetical protein